MSYDEKKIIKQSLIIAKRNGSQLRRMKFVTHNVFLVLIEPNGKLLFLGDKGPEKNNKKFAQYNKSFMETIGAAIPMESMSVSHSTNYSCK